jgi:hypothetical protein
MLRCQVVDRSPNNIPRIGVGGIVPKDIEDGSFTGRIRTSDDKLLQQLIGKKKAKAHITAKQEAARPNAAGKVQRYGKPAAKKEESDDEEGRAATFKSKRQKKKEKQEPKKVDSDDEDEETRAKRLEGSAAQENEEGPKDEITAEAQADAQPVKKEDDDEEAEVTQPTPKKARTKPKSFLDEILAERSKKKSKKEKTQA